MVVLVRGEKRYRFEFGKTTTFFIDSRSALVCVSFV